MRMTNVDIPLDKAELLSVLLESLLYGFSLLMFGATTWTLVVRRSTRSVNQKMLVVACLLLLGSTAHLVIDIIRVMEGLILYRDTYPEGPVAYFSNISQWTFVSKCYVYVAQTLIGDGVVLYRCYVTWQSKPVMILPALLWCSVAITGVSSSYALSRATQSGVFGGAIYRWITSFWIMALTTNLCATLLLVWRIWQVDRQARKLCCHQQSQLGPTLYIILDAGAIYSLTLLVALTCFAMQTNGQYVVLDMVSPIISITFYMVIIRVGMATRANADHTTIESFGNASVNQNASAERRGRTQVRVITMTESVVVGDRLSMTPLTKPSHVKDPPSGIRFEDVGLAV